jgi:hypothetical protein
MPLASLLIAAAAPLAGLWVVGEAADCSKPGTNAWVLMADGIYAETTLPQGPITAVGRWRDGGDRLIYTHAHIPFTADAPERAMVMTERTDQRLAMTAPSGRKRVFSRCPAGSLSALPGQPQH